MPTAKAEYERSGAIIRRKLAAAIWQGRNSEQRRFLNVGGFVLMELFAPGPPRFSECKKQDFIRYFQSLDIDSCELIVIDRCRGAHFRSAHYPLSA
jgi:hypothetical protein